VLYNGDPEDATELKEILSQVKTMISETEGQETDGQAATADPLDSGDGSGSGDSVPTGTVEVLFGPVVPDDGPVDLGTWDFSGLASFIDMMSAATFVPVINQIFNGAKTCPKKSTDDEVPVCPS
jgi:hypothetical protein